MIFSNLKIFVFCGCCNLTAYYKNYKVSLQKDFTLNTTMHEAENKDKSIHFYLNPNKDPLISINTIVDQNEVDVLIADLQNAKAVIDHYQELLPLMDRAIEIAKEKNPKTTPELWRYRTTNIDELCDAPER